MWLSYEGDLWMRYMLMLAMCNTFFAFRDTREKATEEHQPQGHTSGLDGEGGCETMMSADSEGYKLPICEFCFYQRTAVN